MHTTQEIASHLKDELNRKYNGNWHCIVGRHFGSYITYEAKHYIYFYISQYGFLLFKTVKNWMCDLVLIYLYLRIYVSLLIFFIRLLNVLV